MQCPYCRAEYSLGESCHCHPTLSIGEAPSPAPKVKGPWGETVAAWSLPPDTGESRRCVPADRPTQS